MTSEFNYERPYLTSAIPGNSVTRRGASPGYGLMNKDDHVSALAENKHFLKLYGERRLKEWLDRNHDLPQNDKVCGQAVWFTQTLLLAERSAMDQIAEAIRTIQKPGADLARA
jgi:hypothetical protein